MPWFSHCFATIDNFCLVFLQWLNKTKNKKKQKNKTPKNQETKKPKDKKNKKQNDKTQLSATTTPRGVCNLVFCFFFWFLFFLVSWFFGFLFFGSFLVSSAMAKQNQKTKKKDPTLCHYYPPWGVQSCFFLFFKTTVKKNYGKMQVSLEEAWGAWDTN